MNMNEWLNGLREPGVYKCMPILTFPSVSLLGCSVKDIVTNSDLQAKGMKAISDRVKASACVSFMDLSVEAEAFGSEIRFADNEVPVVTKPLVTTVEEAEALTIPQVGAGRTGLYVDSIAKARKLINDRPLLAGAIGPFSLAGRLNDVSEILMNCYDDEDLVHALMKKVTPFIIDYIKAFKTVGADGVLLAEPLTGLMSADMAAEFSEPYVKQIADAVIDDSFALIYHNCGNNAGGMLDSILRTGCSAYHFGNAVDMRKVIAEVPADVIVMGNVDPASQFCNGTPDSIRKATLDLLADCGAHANYVPSSGCDIPPHSPWENIDSFFGAVADYYAK